MSIDKIDRAKGVGLGVILCHTLVKKNQGVLTFASEAGKGTTVTIELQNVAVWKSATYNICLRIKIN